MFLQVHFLTSYHASLLNRDDVGLAKRINFGGSPRLRVSSQCQKRHWREWILVQKQPKLPKGFRTRYFFDRIVKENLIEKGIDDKVAHELALHLGKVLLKAAKGKNPIGKETLKMEQVVLFGEPETNYIVELARAAAAQKNIKDAKNYINERIDREKENFNVMFEHGGYKNPAAGFEGALFGRFVTSDILSRIDAPVHVSHAFTTHSMDTEIDYFTTVDDLDKIGAGHTGDAELGCGIFYGYVVVDIPLLVRNLTGCKKIEWIQQEFNDVHTILVLLLNAITKVSPGAKLGATAPYARAECVLLEVGEEQPRSLANAFLNPINNRQSATQPMKLSIDALARYMNDIDEMYGTSEKRFVSTIHAWPQADDTVVPLPRAIDESLEAIFGDKS